MNGLVVEGGEEKKGILGKVAGMVGIKGIEVGMVGDEVAGKRGSVTFGTVGMAGNVSHEVREVGLRKGKRDGDLSKKLCRRPIPLRGQVKVGIVLGLAHTLAAIFSSRSSH
ncbi:hypothetical protein RJ640_026804 [Escallonia rubra]|uniref:Uncharacterized protein n=1 Tax=Escallonia rubra TaxID=112253 RepID=A0AA88RAH0_9ASTE|nr:hypothetical protein RJ640_026804 [Escallonia rubra]